ncbi:MAG: hypothetical protein ABH952_10590 [Candidatus Omnitrophota bacterium]
MQYILPLVATVEAVTVQDEEENQQRDTKMQKVKIVPQREKEQKHGLIKNDA